MTLQKYRAKRNFQRTPEPAGRRLAVREGHTFVVQKHAARRLHFDFRLELDGVLKSWAVPNGPSLDPNDRALAVLVEDHPLDYASFEGVIPEGEYGGGTVMLWDHGTWTPEGDAAAGLRRGKLRFTLHGEKLHGSWTLVRMSGDASEGGKNWLLIKRRDEYSARNGQAAITDRLPLSVKSRRDLEQIAADADAVWRSGDGTRLDFDLAALPGATRAPQPQKLQPQLATAVSDPPAGDSWLHELKIDGYRLVAIVENGNVRLLTRRGNDWTDRFPRIAEAVETIPIRAGILDGEVAWLSPDGTTDFQALQNVLRTSGDGRLAYFLFDMPYCEGFDLTQTPLAERKRLLAHLLRGELHPALRYSDHIAGRGNDVLSQACTLHLEGIISKRADSSYEQRRTSAWVKVKCRQRQEFVIGGFTAPSGARERFGALLVGYYDEQGELQYAGRVGTGFSHETLHELGDEMEQHLQLRSPFEKSPRSRGVRWVEPVLVAEVEFAQWTDDGLIRQAAFKGQRRDKLAHEVFRQMPAKTPKSSVRRKSLASSSQPNGEPGTVAGVRLSSPDRILYPEQDLTKLDLARYYESIAAWVMPWIANRPLTLVRCPRGRSAKCFYQRHVNASTPDVLDGIEIEEHGEKATYLYIRDIAGLITLVQLGALEIHPWGSRVDNVERPDQIVFDFDPAEDVAWERVVDAAIEMRALLHEVGLTSFVRTTGGKGLHVVAPIVRRTSWDDVKQFAHDMADWLVRRKPDAYIATASKAKRVGKIFVDYLRNSRSATAIGNYSTRARAGAPVATPLDWGELSPALAPASFNITTVPQRLSKRRVVPWSEFEHVRQSLTKAMRRKAAKR